MPVGLFEDDEMPLLPTPTPEDAEGLGELSRAIGELLGIELEDE